MIKNAKKHDTQKQTVDHKQHRQSELWSEVKYSYYVTDEEALR